MIKVAAGKERYFRWYEAICARGQVRALDSGFERHHIVPRSLGGTDDASNLTRLSYREHFLAHWLLTKFTEDEALHKMRYALYMMTWTSRNNADRIVSSWQFDVARSASRDARAGRECSEVTRERISAAQRGRSVPESRRTKIGDANRNRPKPPRSAAHRASLSAALSGRKLSDDHVAKVVAAIKRRPAVSEATRAKLSEAGRGKKYGPRSEETKARLRDAWVRRRERDGAENTWSGRKHSADSIEKMRASKLGKTLSADARAKVSAFQKGRPKAEETREKMKQAWVRRKAVRANNELASHAVA